MLDWWRVKQEALKMRPLPHLLKLQHFRQKTFPSRINLCKYWTKDWADYSKKLSCWPKKLCWKSSFTTGGGGGRQRKTFKSVRQREILFTSCPPLGTSVDRSSCLLGLVELLKCSLKRRKNGRVWLHWPGQCSQTLVVVDQVTATNSTRQRADRVLGRRCRRPSNAPTALLLRNRSGGVRNSLKK